MDWARLAKRNSFHHWLLVESFSSFGMPSYPLGTELLLQYTRLRAYETPLLQATLDDIVDPLS